ncbi:MAG TPA: NAD(+)/NADH kinase [Dehalococcoidales bacterium]
MKKVGIIYHPMKKEAVKLAKELEKFLSWHGIVVWSCSAWENKAVRSKVNGTDLILSIGGDGTILRAAQAVVPGKIPITGINLGNLGFMTELSVKEAKDKIGSLLAGEGWIDERALLEAELTPVNADETGKFHALNDVVLARGAVVRVIFVEATIDNQPTTTYKADGVIVATATGSTGYAYAAGGPILHPHAKEMVLAPIMPHLSASYCLVLPSTATVRLRLQTVHPASLSIDGHTNISIESGAVVTVKHSRDTLRFLRIHPEADFYSSLEKRLKGKQ